MHLVDLGRLNPCPLPQRVSRPVTPAIVRVTDEFSFGELISGAEPPVLEEHTEDLEELTTPVSSALDTGWDDEWSDEWEVEHFQDGAGGADPWEESSFESLLEQDLDMEETAETLLPDLAPFLAQTTAGLPRPLPYAQAVAEVLRARQASSLGRQGADAALKALAGRLGGEYQWCASHGPILASSVDILLERQRLAGLCSALSRLVAWTSRSDKDPFQHLMMRFGGGTLLFAVLPDRSLLVGLVPPEVPTGVALNEVRQVALLLPALERLSPSLVRG
jgi:hypothetical protein